MLIIFESYDGSGKTTLAKELSIRLNIPYIKLNNIQITDNVEIRDNVSISTHSQLETFVQLYEKGVIKDAIIDRFHVSEVVYSKLFKRTGYSKQYLYDLEERLLKFNDVLLVKTHASISTLKKRWLENEKLLDISDMKQLVEYYDKFYKFQTKLPFIEIDTDFPLEDCISSLTAELYIRNIYDGHLRPMRFTHEQAMMDIAKTIAKRSPDTSRQVGAVLTENGFLIGAGYNGPPSGLKHDDIDFRKVNGFKSGEGLDFSRSIHAEQNAIMQSGLRSKSNGKLELFCTTSPCIHCTRMLIQIGISKITYLEKYNDTMAELMWEEAGIEVVKYE